MVCASDDTPMDVAHVAIWVSDLDRSREFYEDVLGLEHEMNFVADGVTNYFVRGETDALVQFKYDPEGERKIEPGGLAHIAVGVDDVDEVFDRLTGRGGSTVRREPQTLSELGVRNAFVEDPDGYVLELEQTLE